MSESDLKLLTVRALRELAKKYLGPGYSRLKTKAELITALAKKMSPAERRAAAQHAAKGIVVASKPTNGVSHSPTTNGKAEPRPTNSRSEPKAEKPSEKSSEKIEKAEKAEPSKVEPKAEKFSRTEKPARGEKPAPSEPVTPPSAPATARPSSSESARKSKPATPAEPVPTPIPTPIPTPTPAPSVAALRREAEEQETKKSTGSRAESKTESKLAGKELEGEIAEIAAAIDTVEIEAEAAAEVEAEIGVESDVESEPKTPAEVEAEKVEPRVISKAEQDLINENLGDLPWGYDDDAVVVMARDPHTLWVYWDFSFETQRRSISGLTNPRAVLRLYDGAEVVREVEIALEAKSWYLHNVTPGHKYRAEIQYVSRQGPERRRIGGASNQALVPSEGPSPVIEDRFVTLPYDTPLTRNTDLLNPERPHPPVEPFPQTEREALWMRAEAGLHDEMPRPPEANETATVIESHDQERGEVNYTVTRKLGSSDTLVERFSGRSRFGGRWTSSRPR
jgi:hypothetical protein